MTLWTSSCNFCLPRARTPNSYFNHLSPVTVWRLTYRLCLSQSSKSASPHLQRWLTTRQRRIKINHFVTLLI